MRYFYAIISAMCIGVLIWGFWGDAFYAFTAFLGWITLLAFIDEVISAERVVIQHDPKG